MDAATAHPETFGDLPALMDSKSIDAAFKKKRSLETEKKKRDAVEKLEELRPSIVKADAVTWMKLQPECDLLITDPPYKTDVDDIFAFANSWLPIALAKVKNTGRAYICIGSYPDELRAYLNIEIPQHLNLSNILVWTYRNTLGPSPKMAYKNNWQAILYYYGINAPALNCPVMLEQFSVQDISAPDGRQGDRYHAWQKPEELARRLIAHSTQAGDTVLDPFAGTGTFIIVAAKLGRKASGCDSNDKMLDIAISRGCKHE
jgi:DNA modification methylase